MEGLALLGKVEKTLFIECFTEWGMSEQVRQKFLCSQEQEGGSSREGSLEEASEILKCNVYTEHTNHSS